MKKKETRHKPCKHRKRETRDGVEMDWCYAIGFERVGDMPCEYCSDWRDEKAADKKSSKSKQKGTTKKC